MKLLIVTQKVDKDDDILGFFHRWILEFAKYYEFITVIALQVGEYDLPKNVKVLSLGKENGKSRIKYIFNFYKYIFRERKKYDAVFVHMNPEYAVLGGLFRMILRKNIYLWYNHKKGGVRARIAKIFSKKVFYTSPFAYMARFKKSKIMPIGIDTEMFKRNRSIEKEKGFILSFGRISPVKNIDVLINALVELDKKGIEFEAYIYGNPTDRDRKYYEKTRDTARVLEHKNKVIFQRGISYKEIPDICNKASIFVNLTPSGSFDKAIIEAMACETISIIENESLKGSVPPELFFDGSAENLADRVEYILSLSDEEMEKIGKLLRYEAVEKHSLNLLARNLKKEIKYK
ncbi:MAG: glycosyltransferase family 4 protein [Candidatus Pacebacteria bacterium]|jgi:glycosyltransferase involved in cell wall biosynthesis|nr:glycosyltransferase family 4 protein [Candidatus Paceibacterota bacterium]|tara:strand:- start:8380 stop:9417 length:1038 start_codon:yes stop_codon:yes gene_type:complete